MTTQLDRPQVAAPDLLRALNGALGSRTGDGVVDASTRRRAEYTSDASNYRVVPQAVVFPRTTEELAAVVATCREQAVPLTLRGAGTSVAGNACGPGVVVDTSVHLNRVLELDPTAQTALVEPGIVLDALQGRARQHGLRFGPDPSTHARCTLGGMIGNDACGSHALAYGRTSANVLELDVVDGLGRSWSTTAPPPELVAALQGVAAQHLATLRTRFATFGRQVSGYALETLLPEHGGPAGDGGPGGHAGKHPGSNLARLLSGSEGTLAVLTRARVRLVRESPATTFVVLGYPDMASAADDTPALLEHGPLAVEGLDRRLVEVVRARGGDVDGLPDGDGWLFVEMGGDTPAQALAGAHRLVAAAGTRHHVIIPTAAQARALWRIREDGAGYAGRSPSGTAAWPGWEDAAVPPARLGTYLRDLQALMGSHGVDGHAYGHFGDGCIHMRLDLPLSEPGGVDRSGEFLRAAARLVAAHGGSLSGEHGDGRARSALLPLMYDDDALRAFEQVKAAFDPDDLLNPGVLVRPAPLEADLRVPAARTAVEILPARPLSLSYPADGGDLTAAVHRCVGVGKCRAEPATGSGGVMCPSYLATRDEKDSTRGRARLLQEMANGTLVTDGWRSEEVLESLDLCLSCKGCSVDCPAGVDMATYKAEFLDHHYRGRRRPLNHYLLGWLPRWTRLVALGQPVLPALVNLAAKAGPLRRAGMRAGGIDPAMAVPRFAHRTFRSWFSKRSTGRDHGLPPQQLTDVVLWVDTFTDGFDPQVGVAAVKLLEHLGFRVHLPSAKVCCGLTWVSTGQLDGAKRQLAATLDALDGPGGELAGMPVVGLEPSCTALLREDAARLLPDDPRAAALHHRTRTVAELIAEHRPDWTPPQLSTEAVVQPHCHQHAVMGFGADAALLARAGVDATQLGGCCGLAGNFGAEAGHRDVSVAVAEQQLLPALRKAGDAVPVVADGFSCRTQTDALAGRRPKHLVELLAEALPDR